MSAAAEDGGATAAAPPRPAVAIGDLAFLAAANALVATAWFAVALGRFVASHHRVVPALDRVVLVGYAAAAYATFALAFWAVSRLVAPRVPPRLLRAVALAALALACLVAYVDQQLFALVGVHLYSDTVREALRNAQFNRAVHLDRGAAAVVAAWGAAALLLEAALLWGSRWLASRLRPPRRLLLAGGVALALTWIVTLVQWPVIASFSAPDGVANLLPWQGWVAARPGPAVRFTPSYPGAATVPKLRRKPTILFVVVESFRADAVNAELTPNIERFARVQRCLRPRHHFSGSHVTELGVFSLLYGLHAYHFDPFAQAGLSSFPLHVLAQNGYRLAGASGSDLLKWTNSGFMVKQLPLYQEFPELERGWQRDARLLEWARRYHRELGGQGPSFLFLFLDSPHVDYSYPPELERDRPVLEDNWVRHLGTAPLATLERPIRNRYRNSIRHVDRLFGQLVDEYRVELERGELALILTGDHGEAFWEHGLWGHLGAAGEPAASEVPLLVCLPGVTPPQVAVSGHVDVWPTLLDYLVEPPAPTFATFSNGRSLLDPARDPCAVVVPKSFLRQDRQLYLMSSGRRSTLEASLATPVRFTVAARQDWAAGAVDPPARCIEALSRHFADFLSR